jgi:GMP synthase (glutamine-hydrolysing)
VRPILYLQNDPQDGPGLLATVLGELGGTLEVIHAWKGERVPAGPEAWAAIAIGGGGMSAYELDHYPFLFDEMGLIRAAHREGIPLLGFCLGAQLVAGAFGGEVFANRKMEIGFYPVRLDPKAAADPLWQGQPVVFEPVHWHGDTFSLPPDAELLASSAITPHQLFRLEDRHYGLQFHLEIDAPVLTDMVTTDRAWLAEAGVDPDGFLRSAAAALPAVEPIGRAVFTRWFEMVRRCGER